MHRTIERRDCKNHGDCRETKKINSMILESNLRRLTRTELICQCIPLLAKAVYRENSEFLPDSLKHCADPKEEDPTEAKKSQ